MKSGRSTIVSQLRLLTDRFLSLAAQDLNERLGRQAVASRFQSHDMMKRHACVWVYLCPRSPRSVSTRRTHLPPAA